MSVSAQPRPSTFRRSMAVLALLALGSTVLQSASSTAAQHGLEAVCDSPRYVPTIGMACPAAGGYTIMFEDGTFHWTHGPDPVPAESHAGSANFGDITRKPVCVKDPRNEYHHKALYVYSFDSQNRATLLMPEIRRMVAKGNGFLYEESKRFGRPLQYRAACSKSGDISVDVVEVDLPYERQPAGGALQDYINVINAVRREGYTSPFAKYWVYVDMPPRLGAAGIASGAIGDDRLVAENWNNFGPGYGVYYGLTGDTGAFVMMHEDAHTLGAVSINSPNTSRAFHCIDGNDVMCYADGGARSQLYSTTVCKRMAFDCNYDDYFNPRPGAKNFLKDHWNLGSPLNRFFEGCSYRTARMTGAGGPAAGLAINGASKDVGKVLLDTFSIPKKCRGRIFALSGAQSLIPEEGDEAVGILPHTQLPAGIPTGDRVIGDMPVFDSAVTAVTAPDFDVCFFKGSKQLKCFEAIGTDQGTVPSSATKAVIAAKDAIDGVYVFSAI